MTPPRVLLLSSVLASLAVPAMAQGIEFSTLLGGAGADRAYAVARSIDGRVFVAGHTPSPAFLGTAGPSDGFVACFDPAQSGAALLRWVTLIGVSGELGIAIVMDIGLVTVDAWGLGGQSFRAPSDPVFAGQEFAIQGASVDRNGPVHLTLTNRATIRL